MITDLQMTYAAFDLWLSAEGEDNRAELERVKQKKEHLRTGKRVRK